MSIENNARDSKDDFSFDLIIDPPTEEQNAHKKNICMLISLFLTIIAFCSFIILIAQ